MAWHGVLLACLPPVSMPPPDLPATCPLSAHAGCLLPAFAHIPYLPPYTPPYMHAYAPIYLPPYIYMPCPLPSAIAPAPLLHTFPPACLPTYLPAPAFPCLPACSHTPCLTCLLPAYHLYYLFAFSITFLPSSSFLCLPTPPCLLPFPPYPYLILPAFTFTGRLGVGGVAGAPTHTPHCMPALPSPSPLPAHTHHCLPAPASHCHACSLYPRTTPHCLHLPSHTVPHLSLSLSPTYLSI